MIAARHRPAIDHDRGDGLDTVALRVLGSGLVARRERWSLQNLAWATGYNVFALPLAAGVLASAGIVLAPAVGALLVSASTVVVAFNAQLVRRSRELV